MKVGVTSRSASASTATASSSLPTPQTARASSSRSSTSSSAPPASPSTGMATRPGTSCRHCPNSRSIRARSLTQAQLERLTGRYALKEGIVLTVTVEDGHLFLRENDEEKQEYLPESSQDFYSTTSSDECIFQPAEGPAQVLGLHLDDGRNIEFKRIP